MKNLFLILTTILFVGCSDSDDSNFDFYNIYSGAEFGIFNTDGQDLLNPDNPDHWDTSAFRVFYLINGEVQEVYNPNMDDPRGYTIYKHANEYRAGVTLNNSETEEYPITYIEWNDEDTDTVRASFQRTEYGIIQDTLWLNDEVVWELGDNTTDPYFELTK
ncbi:MAG: hypothetical protein WCY16_07800 [Weeksellaceae bacterium]